MSTVERPARVITRAQRTGDPNDRDPGLALGLPPNLGQDVLPHVVEFQGLVRNIAKTYYPSDEALRHSYQNAVYMRNDVQIMECLEQRKRSTALLGWHLEGEEDNSEIEKYLVKELTAIVSRLPFFLKYRESLLEALWFGRYANKHRFRWARVRNKDRIVCDHWEPLHGDKLVFRYDEGDGRYQAGQVGIRLGYGWSEGQRFGRWKVEREGKIQSTERGMAYFLEEWERPLLGIHKHIVEDGVYELPESAGRIHGVGIRDRIYWTWFQQTEALAWLMEFLERCAFGLELWSYPDGNPQARDKAIKAAQERIGNGRRIVVVPRHPDSDGTSSDVRVVEFGMAGAETLKNILIEYFGHRIKRYILGQTLTTEAAGTGLGSNLASIHLDTYLQIVRYDSINLGETITSELVRPLLAFNWPKYRDVPIKFVIETESPDIEGKLGAMQKAYEMGLKIPAKEVAGLIGIAKPEEGDEILQKAQPQAQGGGGAFPGIGPLPIGPDAGGSPEMAPQPPEETGGVEAFSRTGDVERYARVGEMKTENGHTYRMNENWRWERADREEPQGQQPGGQPQAAPELSAAEVRSQTFRQFHHEVKGQTVANEATGQQVKMPGDWLKTLAGIAIMGGAAMLAKSGIGRKLMMAAMVAAHLKQITASAKPVEQPKPAPGGGRTQRLQRQVEAGGRVYDVDLTVKEQRDGTWAYVDSTVIDRTPPAPKDPEQPKPEKPARKPKEKPAKPDEGPAIWDRGEGAGEEWERSSEDVRKAWGNKLTEVNPKTEFGKALEATANEYEISPNHLAQAVEFVMEAKQQEFRDREQAKKEIRQRLKLTAGDLARVENAGHDYASAGKKIGGETGKKIAGLDSMATALAGEYPGLIGSPDSGEDLVANLWDLIREGAQRVPQPHDPEILREAAGLVERHYPKPAADEQPEDDTEPGDAFEGEMETVPPDDQDAVPFRRSGLVERFAREFAAHGLLRYAGSWDESKHPRGNPENAGEFAAKGQAVKKTENKISVRRDSARIADAAKELGYLVEEQTASTGTVYLKCFRGDDELTVRVADHMEAYEPRRGERKISVSPDEWSVSQALEALKKPDTVKPYQPDPEAVKEHRQALAEQAAGERKQKQGAAKNAKELRETLPDWVFEEFNKAKNRPNVQKIAEKLGVKPGRLWMALTGKPY